MNTHRGVNIHDEGLVRLEKLSALRAAGVEPYPARAKRTHTVMQALALREGETGTIAGRLLTKREMVKIMFCHLLDDSGRMQIALKKDKMDESLYALCAKKIDAGDLFPSPVCVLSTEREPSIRQIMDAFAKALLPLPKMARPTDTESRLQAVSDLIMDESVKDRMRPPRIISFIRQFLDTRGFVEVETPTLQPVYGGGFASLCDASQCARCGFYLRILTKCI